MATHREGVMQRVTRVTLGELLAQPVAVAQAGPAAQLRMGAACACS